MNRILKAFGMAAIGLMSLAPIACNHFGPVNPNPALAPTPTLSPTPTSAPGCYFTSITLPDLGISSTCWAAQGGTPVTNILNSRMNTGIYVIKNQADWASFYGCTSPPTPPVNLNSQMIIAITYQLCFESPYFSSICESQTQVTVSITDVQPAYECFGITTPPAIVAVAVPQSNLPITWQFTIVP